MNRRTFLTLLSCLPLIFKSKTTENPYIPSSYRPPKEILIPPGKYDDQIDSITNLYGVPYHESNGTSGTWLGFSRK